MEHIRYKNITIYLDSKSNYYGFKHLATLNVGYWEELKTSIQYYNRTWERFDYETILYKIINLKLEQIEEQAKRNYKQNNNIKRLTKDKQKDFKKELKNYDTYKNLLTLKNRIKRANSLYQLTR